MDEVTETQWRTVDYRGIGFQQSDYVKIQQGGRIIASNVLRGDAQEIVERRNDGKGKGASDDG